MVSSAICIILQHQDSSLQINFTMNTDCKYPCSKTGADSCSLGKVSADHVQVVNSMFNNALFVLRLTPTFTFISMSDLVKGYESILEDRIQDILSKHPHYKVQWDVCVSFQRKEFVTTCLFNNDAVVYSKDFLENGAERLDEKIQNVFAFPSGYVVGRIVRSDLTFTKYNHQPTMEDSSESSDSEGHWWSF